MQALLQPWVTGGGLIDTIIAITLLEVAALLAYHHQTKRGLAPRDYLLNVASGMCLMLALRCAILDSGWYLIAALLTGAGAAHVADVAWRLKQPTKTR